MGPNALKYILNVARKSLVKDQGSGIMQVPGRMDAEAKASEFVTRLTNAGIDLGKMDDFIKSEADVKKYLNILDAMEKEKMKVIPADSPRGKEITEQLFGKRGEVVDMKGNVIPEGSGIMGGESIESLMKSGDVSKGTVTKKSKKATDRDMFRAANERFSRPKSEIDSIIRNIKKLDPIEAMKEANKLLKREDYYKNMSAADAKRILSETEDHIFQRNVAPMETDVDVGGARKEISKLEKQLGNLDPKAKGFQEKSRELINKIEQLKNPEGDEVTKAYIDAVRKGKFEGTEDQFRDMIDKMMDEDFARGGRVGLKDGPADPSKRKFMKIAAGLASIPIVGKFFKTAKVGKAVTKVPLVKTPNAPGKPEWFDALVNKVILEGDDVTKKLAIKDRQTVHTKKIDNDSEVTVYRDLDDNSVRVEYNSPDVMLDEPVSLTVKPGQADETIKKAPPAEFETYEQGFVARSNGPDDYSIDPEPMIGNSIKDLETDVTKLKEFATGEKQTLKEFVQSKKRKDKVKKINQGDIGETSDYVTKRQGDYYPEYDDYASGGIAGMLGE